MRRLAALLLLATPATLDAQPSPAAPHPLVGLRARITSRAAPGGRVVGTVLSVDHDAVRIRAEGGSALALPYDTIRRLEGYGGHGSRASEGAGFGFLLGAAAGYALSAANPGALRWGRMTQPEANLVGAAIVGPIGGFLGAAIGSRIRTERWKKIEWRGVTFDLRPHPARGLILSASW